MHTRLIQKGTKVYRLENIVHHQKLQVQANAGIDICLQSRAICLDGRVLRVEIV